MAGIENPEIKKQSRYTISIEEQLVYVAEIISQAINTRENDVVISFQMLKQEIDTLQMLCYNVLNKYKNIENKDNIDKLHMDTLIFLKARMPKHYGGFQTFFQEARRLYMMYNHVLIDCGAIKI